MSAVRSLLIISAFLPMLSGPIALPGLSEERSFQTLLDVISTSLTSTVEGRQGNAVD